LFRNALMRLISGICAWSGATAAVIFFINACLKAASLRSRRYIGRPSAFGRTATNPGVARPARIAVSIAP
jgi:hypothetical protein